MTDNQGTTEVSSYFKRARTLYPFFGINNFSNKHGELEKADLVFMRTVLGIKAKNNWYAFGIKSIYWKILNLSEENQKLKEEKAKAEMENRELKEKIQEQIKRINN